MKLEVPRFDGEDPMGWIFKISQFFDYQRTPEEERITVASFYMDGPALSWYQWMFRNGLITSWHGLLQALESRFAPSFYDDPKGALFKLSQKGSVNEYLTEFERLANRIVGLPASFLLSCFISGLSPEIRREVQALQPVSLPQATALAKLQEDKIEDRKRSYKGKGVFAPPSNTSQKTLPNQSPQPQTPSNPSSGRFQFKRISPEEMAARREKGLCYNCDEKWSNTHKCKGRLFLFVAETDEDGTEDPSPIPVDTPYPPVTKPKCRSALMLFLVQTPNLPIHSVCSARWPTPV